MTQNSLRILPQSGERSGQVDLVKTAAHSLFFGIKLVVMSRTLRRITNAYVYTGDGKGLGGVYCVAAKRSGCTGHGDANKRVWCVVRCYLLLRVVTIHAPGWPVWGLFGDLLWNHFAPRGCSRCSRGFREDR